jgi:O-antigen ligase
VPTAIGVALTAWIARPRIGGGANRVLDAALVGVLAVLALQLVPLPAALRLSVAPSAIAFERAVQITDPPSASGPISVDRDATAYALYVVGVVMLFFWSVRQALERGSVRRVTRGIAVLGLVVAPLAMAQHVLSPKAFYGEVRPIATNALPFTPFINRNDFAAWLLMAVPLTLGYAIARIQSRRQPGDPLDPETAFDNPELVLGLSMFAMMAALFASLSRSGIAGLLAAIGLFLLVARGRMSRERLRGIALGLAAMLVLGVMYTNTGALGNRLGGAVSEGLVGRIDIWRQTWPMVTDFWPLGSGVGTYQRVMVLYQTMSRRFSISHADNEYLQVLAEGGAPLAIPFAIAIVAGVLTIRRRLLADHTPIYWVRAGAACGMFGLAIQNLFEMTLRVPANAVLFALLAAIATHRASRAPGPS